MASLGILGSSKRQKLEEENEGKSVDDGIDDSSRPWSDLPSDLLSLIAKRLGIIELLGFRGVCKGWRCASSSASADIESAFGIKPSFLVYSENEKKWSLYYRGEEKMYSMNIPELEKATCIASNWGWLLLLEESSMFFFCPFSRARIELPQFPDSELSNLVAAFSAPPTSPECMVSVANQCKNFKVELYVLTRCKSAWTKHERNCPPHELGTITGAVYCEEESGFYFLDSFKKTLKFSLKDKKFFPYRIVSPSEDPDCDSLPFAFCVDYFSHCGMRACMRLQDDASVSTRGTVLSGEDFDTCINNEMMEALNGKPSNSQLKGIWIQARFLQVPPTTQAWSL